MENPEGKHYNFFTKPKLVVGSSIEELRQKPGKRISMVVNFHDGSVYISSNSKEMHDAVAIKVGLRISEEDGVGCFNFYDNSYYGKLDHRGGTKPDAVQIAELKELMKKFLQESVY